jgi:hypothetical protein
MGVARDKTPGTCTQLNTMVNMPVKFYDCDSYTFGVMHDRRLHPK